MSPRAQREAGAESRDRLLAAGSALIHELPAKAFLRSLTARSVAARAGYSQGAFYHHWGTQEDYISDLVDWLLDSDRAESAQVVAELLTDGVRIGTAEAIVALTEASVREAIHSEAFVAQLVLWAHYSTDELISEKIRALQRRVTADTLAGLRYLITEHGWAPAEGLSEEEAAEAMGAVVRGFALRCAVDETVDPRIAGIAVLRLLIPPDPAA